MTAGTLDFQIMENEYVQHVNAFQEFMRIEANVVVLLGFHP